LTPRAQVNNCWKTKSLVSAVLTSTVSRYQIPHYPLKLKHLERFSVDVNRNNKGVPRGAQIRFGLL